MYEIRNASEMGEFGYTNPKWVYFEVRDNKFHLVASGITDAKRDWENSLKSAAMRAQNGESSLMAVSGDVHGNITFFRIDDIDALLTAYGLSDKQAHRHQIHWEYSSSDNGKDVFAEVELRFLCGCHLNSDNVRTRAKEFRDQYGLELRLSRVRYTMDPSYVQVGIKRKELKNKEHDLK